MTSQNTLLVKNYKMTYSVKHRRECLGYSRMLAALGDHQLIICLNRHILIQCLTQEFLKEGEEVGGILLLISSNTAVSLVKEKL